MGKIVKDTDWMGKPVEKHFDDSGNLIRVSKPDTNAFGSPITKDYDAKGNLIGTTKVETSWIGKDESVHRNTRGEKTGVSRAGTSMTGKPVTEHYDGSYNLFDTTPRELASSSTANGSSADSGCDAASTARPSSSRGPSGGDYTGSSDYSGSGSDNYVVSDSTSFNAGGFIKFVFGALGLVLLLSMCTSMCSNKTTAPVQQQSSQNSYQPVKKAKKARKHKATTPPAQEEVPRQEAVQPPSERVEEQARTVREFRVPMNPSIAAANEFSAEVRLPDGRTESVTIAGLTKGNNTLYVTLSQGYPEGTVVTIYPKIEYVNRFVVPGNPGILTSPSVNVAVQLPDGRSFQPCVQNIERGMTQLVVTTCDNYPTGTRVIVNPVYGGYRRY